MVGQRNRTPSALVAGAILEAASQLMEEGGIAALGIRQIAARAGVAPMGVYSRFAGKPGILDALFRSGFEQLDLALRGLDEIDDPLAALREGGRRYRSLALARPAAYRLMFMGAAPSWEPSLDSKLAALSAFDGLRLAVVRCMAAGSIRQMDPFLAAQLVWSTIHGWVSLEIEGMSFYEGPAEDELLDLLEAGLAPPPEGERRQRSEQ